VGRRSNLDSHKKSSALQRLRLLRFARAPKDEIVILRKCPWGAMTTYKDTNYYMNFWETTLAGYNVFPGHKSIELPSQSIYKQSMSQEQDFPAKMGRLLPVK